MNAFVGGVGGGIGRTIMMEQAVAWARRRCPAEVDWHRRRPCRARCRKDRARAARPPPGRRRRRPDAPCPRAAAGRPLDVEVASDGREALEPRSASAPRPRPHRPPPPGMDGFDLIRELRAAPRTRTVPIVVISGLTEEADRLQRPGGGRQRLPDQALLRARAVPARDHPPRDGASSAARPRCARARRTSARSSTARSTPWWPWTPPDVITYWNPQAETTFGWTREEALGPPVRRAHPPARAAAGARPGPGALPRDRRGAVGEPAHRGRGAAQGRHARARSSSPSPW